MTTSGEHSKTPRSHSRWPTRPRRSTQPAAAFPFSTRTSFSIPSRTRKNQIMFPHPKMMMTVPVRLSHRSTRIREQNHDTAQTEQPSLPGPPLPLQTPPEPPPSSDPPDHSPKEPMTLRKQVPPSSILTPPPSLGFQTSNSVYTRSPPCPPSTLPQNRAGDLEKSTCFSLSSRFKGPIPSM
jgi:hypothetical protein